EFARALKRIRQRAGDEALADVADRLARDRARLAELGDMFSDGELDRAEYRRLTDRTHSRIDAAESRLATAAETAPGLRYMGQGDLLRDAWEELTLEERRTIIGAVVEHFVIEPAAQPRNIWRPERVQHVWRFGD